MQLTRFAALSALGAALLMACGNSDSGSTSAPLEGGQGGSGQGQGQGGGSCAGSAGKGASGAGGGLDLGTSSCEAGKYIFVTTLDNQLMRFDPVSLSIDPVTKLSCKPDKSTAVPSAFAVDKQSIAWIIYTDGTLHRLDMTQLGCEKTAYVPYQQGWQKFAMTFNDDPDDPTGESIVVADLTLNSTSSDNDVKGLGKISTSDLKLKPIGDFDGMFAHQRALITGRRDGRLFAYFIDNDLPRRLIAEIDPKTAQVKSPTPVPMPGAVYGSFAHWGGSYYYFYTSDEFTNSSIARFTPGKGTKILVKDAGRILYGASVSTCAPTQPPDIK